jgi:hypothetical protein
MHYLLMVSKYIAEVEQRCSIIGWVTKNFNLELLRASEGTLSRWSWRHTQSLAPTNWARVVGYGPSSLCVIQKEDLCPRSGDSNKLMMMNLTMSIKITKNWIWNEKQIMHSWFLFDCYLLTLSLRIFSKNN